MIVRCTLQLQQEAEELQMRVNTPKGFAEPKSSYTLKTMRLKM